MMEFSDLLITGGVGAGGAGGGCAIGWYLLRRVLDRQDKLENEVKNLRDKELAEIKTDLKNHVKEDTSAVTEAILERIEGGVLQLTSKIDNFALKVAEQGAEIKGDHGYIENVNKALQDHKRDGIHHAK